MISDTVASSDQMPFTMAGVPDAMFLGNISYYDPKAPPGSYPFDQTQDTIGLMNTFADGGAGQSQALTMALGLPGLLSTWMLSQPSVLGQARPDGRPVAAIGSIGQVGPDRPVTLTATGFVPGARAAKLRYSWAFGDGTSAAGQIVRHSYAGPASLTLRLTVSAPHRAARTISEAISVGRPVTYQNPFTAMPGIVPKTTLEGRPTPNHAVILPTARRGALDKVGRAAPRPVALSRTRSAGSSSSTVWAVVSISVAAAILIAILLALVGRRRAKKIRSTA